MRRIPGLLAGLAFLAACGGDPVATETPAGPRIAAATASRSQEGTVQRDIATLRHVTAPFHSFATARAAGWSAQITPCMADPAAGGMGFHYGNPGLIDGAVSVDQPELLLYEPEKGGGMRLVAVEYIVPLSAWTSHRPPRLFGRDFTVNAVFQIWALHVWVWKDNPSGLFADWNPAVSCANVPAASVMSHH